MPLAFLRQRRDHGGGGDGGASTLGAELLTSSVARHDGFTEQSRPWIGVEGVNFFLGEIGEGGFLGIL